MSYINPVLRNKFKLLPIDLKNEILSRDVHLESLTDLMKVLEQIADGQ